MSLLSHVKGGLINLGLELVVEAHKSELYHRRRSLQFESRTVFNGQVRQLCRVSTTTNNDVSTDESLLVAIRQKGDDSTASDLCYGVDLAEWRQPKSPPP